MKCIICKLGVFALFGVLLLQPTNFVLANSYSRVPAGSGDLENPITINVQRDVPTISDCSQSRYKVAISHFIPNALPTEYEVSDEFSGSALIAGVSKVFNLPVDSYETIHIMCFSDIQQIFVIVLRLECEFYYVDSVPMFSIVIPPPTFSGSLNKTDLISNIGAVSTNLFYDFGQGRIL